MNRPSAFVVTAGLLLAPIVAAAPAGCSMRDHASVTATVERTATAADPRSLSVETRNGMITLVRDDSATALTVTARIRCGGETQAAADARAQASNLVVARGEDGAVRVTAEFAPRADGRAGYSNDAATIEVRAPGSLEGIALRTSNGTITSDGFRGALTARSSNGAIKVTGHAGAVNADTSNGAITVAGIAGPADLATSNGSVDAALAAGSTADIQVRTSNGGVKVTLPASWAGALAARTSNGGVSVKSPEGRVTNLSIARGEGSATIGKGGAKATLRSSNGGITVVVEGE
jgi:DUF4097 and DUF4098 domain-containing protein YvlB